MHIGIDIMGGDFAPKAIIEGADMSLSLLKEDTVLHLFGTQQALQLVKDHPQLVKHACADEILMDEHPVKALQQKPDNSLSRGFMSLKKGDIQAFCSAGNSGAVMVGSHQILGMLPGVARPSVVSVFPVPGDKEIVVLDVGANVDARPEVLEEFGVFGSLYARAVKGIAQPRVALLSTGAESSKGNAAVIKAHQLLSENQSINFIGNVEARDFYDDAADVLVCDGFAGNILLKYTEAFYKLIKLRNIDDPFMERFNYEQYGGTPLLGIEGNVLLAHGVSGAKAISNMLLEAERVAQKGLSTIIKKEFSPQS